MMWTYTLKSCFLVVLLLLLGVVIHAQQSSESDTLLLSSGSTFRANFGITDQSKTVVIPLAANHQSQYLVLENPHINFIHVFARFLAAPIITGDQFSFVQRPLFHRFFVIPIPPLHSPDTVTMTLDKAGENLSFTLHRLDKEQYDRYLANDNIIVGAITGLYALAILLAFVLFYIFKSARFFFFAGYVFFSLCWILNDAGLFYANLWPDSPVWHKGSRGLFSSLTMVFFALYLRQQKNVMLRRGINQVALSIVLLLTLKFLLAFVVAAGLFPDSIKWATMHINSWGLIALFGYVTIYLLFVIRKYTHERYELFGILTYCVFVLNLACREIGFDFISINGFHQFEVILFFPLQCFFMSVQLYQGVQDERKNTARMLVNYEVNQQREFDRKLTAIEQAEKRKIAQNLHDEIGGIFIALKYRLLLLKQKLAMGIQEEDLNEISKLAEHGVAKQHEIIEELISGYNGNNNLQEAIQSHINMISSGLPIEINFLFSVAVEKYSLYQKTQLFRICAELLNNAVKHAEASLVTLRFEDERGLSIFYEDNGKGFVPFNNKDGKGLSNIHQRVNSLAGKIECTSVAGSTSYLITIPVSHV